MFIMPIAGSPPAFYPSVDMFASLTLVLRGAHLKDGLPLFLL
jgi:hypothetical protein